MIWFMEFWLMSVAFFVLKIWSGKECEVEGFWNGLRPQTVDLLWLKRPIVLLMCLASGAGVLQNKFSDNSHRSRQNRNMWNIQSQLYYVLWDIGSLNAVVRTRIPIRIYILLRPSIHEMFWCGWTCIGCIRKSQTTGVNQRIEWINPEDVQKFKFDLVPRTYFITFYLVLECSWYCMSCFPQPINTCPAVWLSGHQPPRSQPGPHLVSLLRVWLQNW